MTGCWVYNMYPPHPIMMATDEYNHFHHLNHTSFEYYLDHRVEEGGVPATADPAILDAFPHGGAIIRLPPFFLHGNSGDAIPEPPPGLQVDRIERITLRPLAAPSEELAQYAGIDGRSVATLRRTSGAWQLTLDDGLGGFKAYGRTADNALHDRFDAPPPLLELVRTTSKEFRFRPSS
jgi:hypothetical protein